MVTSNHRLQSPWIGALDKFTSPEEFYNTLASSVVTKTLIVLLKKRRDELLSLERNPDYTSNDWAFRQAHSNGAVNELTRILKLLNEDKPDNG